VRTWQLGVVFLALLCSCETAKEPELAGLGDSADGCWTGDPDGNALKSRCTDAPRVNYSFYRLDGQPGGGDELRLDFDAAGVCTQARWMSTQ
jgi:hypothetical protein